MNETLTTTACNFLTTAPMGEYYWSQNCWHPYVLPTTTTYIYYTNQEPASDLLVRKVANGFITRFKGQEYVFETIEKLSKFITKHLAG